MLKQILSLFSGLTFDVLVKVTIGLASALTLSIVINTLAYYSIKSLRTEVKLKAQEMETLKAKLDAELAKKNTDLVVDVTKKSTDATKDNDKSKKSVDEVKNRFDESFTETKNRLAASKTKEKTVNDIFSNISECNNYLREATQDLSEEALKTCGH